MQDAFGWQRTLDVFKRIGRPLLFASLTTGLAGLVMTASETLAYIQVGTFLTVISAINFFMTVIFLTVSRNSVETHIYTLLYRRCF